MRPSADIPQLKVVPTDKLHPHESADEQRAGPLVSALRRDRVLKNPPIVLPIEDPDEFVVLDGANRVAAFRLLGLPHCLVQVADPESVSVQVETWNHVLFGIDSEQARRLFTMPELLHTEKMSKPELGSQDLEVLRVMYTDGAAARVRETGGNLHERIEQVNLIANAYRSQVRFERTSNKDISSLNGMYDQVAALVIFPEFSPGEIVEAAGANMHFPPGVTRFIVSPRALRLNYPLSMFDSSESLEEKQQHLETWVRSRVRNRQVRFYAESTFLFDE